MVDVTKCPYPEIFPKLKYVKIQQIVTICLSKYAKICHTIQNMLTLT